MAASKPAKSLSTFGESPSKSLTSVSVRGSERQLLIVELEPVSLEPTGTEFRFSRENFAGPRGGQEFGVSLRTIREDLPGSEEPVEQVLGWNYDEFTVKGIWDDRHAGKGFAEQTRTEFESMVKRGKLIRYQFEQIAMVGLIKNFKTTYVRKEYQPYSFTVSPHFRYKGETIKVDTNKVSKVQTDPKTAVKKARDALDEISANQALASARTGARVQQLLSSDVFSDINTAITSISDSITQAEKLVDTEILGPANNATTALNRGAQTMLSAKTAAASLINRQKGLQASAEVSISSLVEGLKFENWHRTVAGSTRKFVVTSEQTRKDLALRAKGKPKNIHRVRQGESLYQISSKYYGTPHHWREILSANHLSSILLFGGELLEIPEIRG